MSFDLQVICVNDDFSMDECWRWAVRTFPKVNSIYTVREIRRVHDLVGFCFYEIVNPRALFTRGRNDLVYVEPAFHIKNFRPVRKTSIEVFEKLLAPADPAGAARKERRNLAPHGLA
jgi:hypothetical protein